MTIKGFGGTMTIGGVTLKVKSWTATLIRESWYQAWIKRTPRG